MTAKKTDQALRLLAEFLSAGDFRDGDRVPPERKLTTELGVSRRALRGALERLEAEGKLWRGVGRGTFVGQPPVDVRAGYDAMRQASSPSMLMEARETLEPAIAALAATHATAGDLQEMHRCLKKSSGAVDPKGWELWDSALHSAIARATHNVLIQFLFETLNSARADTDWGRLRRASLTAERKRLYSSEHEAIIREIADRHIQGAAQAMRSHLSTVRATLLSVADPD